jgi:hypothetical protein
MNLAGSFAALLLPALSVGLQIRVSESAFGG